MLKELEALARLLLAYCLRELLACVTVRHGVQ